jgi:hypothetical protein
MQLRLYSVSNRIFLRHPSLPIPDILSIKEIATACIGFAFPIGTPAKPSGIFAWLMFIPGKFFVSLHTETLRKPYRKHTKTQERSLLNPYPIPILVWSNPQIQLFILREVHKDSEDSNTSRNDWTFDQE